MKVLIPVAFVLVFSVYVRCSNFEVRKLSEILARVKKHKAESLVRRISTKEYRARLFFIVNSILRNGFSRNPSRFVSKLLAVIIPSPQASFFFQIKKSIEMILVIT